MNLRVLVVAALAFVAACAATADQPPTDPGAEATDLVRLIFLGDVMLGRGVAAVADADPGSVFERLRPVLLDADVVFANLESPLTARPHTAPGFALEADPSAASLLASAGIDVVDLANNHATDAGPDTVLDTVRATRRAGVAAVGAGAGRPATADSPGVNTWATDAAHESVTALRGRADVVVVGVHGGVEYLPRPDPVLERVTGELAGWGADVVWGHGAHVAYPVSLVPGTRSAVVAPGLGNALFDQTLPGTDSGTLLEVLVDADGLVAQRTGRVMIEAGRTSFGGWDLPAGDAVALDGEWWTPVRPPSEEPPTGCGEVDEARVLGGLRAGAEAIDVDCGAVTERGPVDMVVAYRRPSSTEILQRAFPGRRWADVSGRSAHLAVMAPDGRMRWGAATLLDPIGAVRACTGSIVVGLTSLDDPAVIAVAAWTWQDFGFRTSPSLSPPGAIGCADIDHDGTTEPFVRRSAST
ncbi:MAG: CapA family protein [Actinobacteria bacterium]|nr:CapA family protein [Actinomycetota bacterium]